MCEVVECLWVAGVTEIDDRVFDNRGHRAKSSHRRPQARVPLKIRPFDEHRLLRPISLVGVTGVPQEHVHYLRSRQQLEGHQATCRGGHNRAGVRRHLQLGALELAVTESNAQVDVEVEVDRTSVVKSSRRSGHGFLKGAWAVSWYKHFSRGALKNPSSGSAATLESHKTVGFCQVHEVSMAPIVGFHHRTKVSAAVLIFVGEV